MTIATIVHQIPGRMRMRISEKRRDNSYFIALAEQLTGIDGVHDVRVSAATGSVVVKHDGNASMLLQRMQERIADLLIEPLRPNQQGRPLGSLSFRLVSGRQLTPMFMAGTALAAIGLIQTFRGKVAVPSITAFWYAVEAFRQSGKRGNGSP